MLRTSLQDKLNLLRNNRITPRAVLYARFSSDNQREESIDAQVRAVEEFAKANGITIVHHYIDKARSATTDDREQFQQMIKASSAGTFHFVLVHKYDRFARNRADSIGYRLELKKNGVSLVSVLESFDNETPEGALLEGILESMNEFYSRNLAREVMKGLKENAYKAKYNGGNVPYGYDVNDNQDYIINPVEATAVQLMFSMVKQHYSYGEVLNVIHSNGYRTKNGGFFKRNSLHDILSNPRYTGLYTYMRRSPKNAITNSRNSHLMNDESRIIKVPDGIPAIITQELFNDVQAILDSRKQQRFSKASEKSLLSGKIVCAMCGGHYAIERSRLKKSIGYTISYRCNNRKGQAETRCHNRAVLQSYVDEQVINLLSETIFNPLIIPQLLERYNEALKSASHKNTDAIKDLQYKIKGKTKSIANILKSLERVDSEELTSHLTKLESEKKELICKLEFLQADSTVPAMDENRLLELFNHAKNLFVTGELQDRKRLVDIFLDKVLVCEDHLEIILNQAPFIHNADYTKISYSIPRKAKK